MPIIRISVLIWPTFPISTLEGNNHRNVSFSDYTVRCAHIIWFKSELPTDKKQVKIFLNIGTMQNHKSIVHWVLNVSVERESWTCLQNIIKWRTNTGDFSKMLSLLFLVIVSFFTHHCMSHTYSPGSCPNVEPILNFDMTKVYMRIANHRWHNSVRH